MQGKGCKEERKREKEGREGRSCIELVKDHGRKESTWEKEFTSWQSTGYQLSLSLSSTSLRNAVSPSLEPRWKKTSHFVLYTQEPENKAAAAPVTPRSLIIQLFNEVSKPPGFRIWVFKVNIWTVHAWFQEPHSLYSDTHKHTRTPTYVCQQLSRSLYRRQCSTHIQPILFPTWYLFIVFVNKPGDPACQLNVLVSLKLSLDGSYVLILVHMEELHALLTTRNKIYTCLRQPTVHVCVYVWRQVYVYFSMYTEVRGQAQMSVLQSWMSVCLSVSDTLSFWNGASCSEILLFPLPIAA